jgi:hypothetical protein
VDTFATVRESDMSWTEKVWFSIARKDGSLQVDFGLGRYHNRGIMDGFGGVSRGRTQWTVRSSRELMTHPETTVGPLAYEIVEPMRKLRVALAKNDTQPIAFDVMFEASMPPFAEDRHKQRERDGFRIGSDVVRYHQAGNVSGWVEVEGKRQEIKPDEWFAFRDHSWGVRLDVGAHLTDLRGTTDFGDARFGESGYLLNWTPMLLTAPGGERWEYHFYLQQHNRKTFYLSAYRNLPNGEQERIARVRPEVSYDDRTRRCRGGNIHFDMLEGGTRTIRIELLGETGFHLGTALYMGFNGAKHGSWRGKLHVDGERIDDTLDVATLKKIHQFRDTPVKVTEGDASGYGIFESILIGPDPSLGLTAEASFV